MEVQAAVVGPRGGHHRLQSELYAYAVPKPWAGTVPQVSCAAHAARTAQPPSALELSEHKRAKGVARAAVRTGLALSDYRRVLDEQSVMPVEMRAIRSYRHALHTITQTKVALSAFDSKRFVLDGGVATRAYGHWRSSRQERECE